MSQLQKIIYLTREQYDKLQNNEAVTAGGITLNSIDEDNLYFITDETISSDELGDDFILPVKNGGTGVSSITPNSILGTGTTSTAPFIAITKATSITNNANTIPITSAVYNDTLLKSGGTMTGILTVKGNQYADAYSGALNMNNSNIYGLNSIYTADSADNASEGIHFYRDGAHTDSLWIAGGNIYFVPNRALAGSSASTTAANSEKVTRLPASITGSRAIYSDSTSGKLAESTTTSTELGYLHGVTSAIQTQLNGKQANLAFNTEYDASSNKAATMTDITNAINALDGGTIGTGSTTKTITALSQTNGNISATFSNIAFPVTSVNGKTGAVTLADLGLSNALHFIGITSTELTDGSTTATLTAKSTNSLSKTTSFVNGDVVMDGDQLREYVWSGSAWRLLGITTSTKYEETTSGNTFISKITQATDGTVTAESRTLDTSGPWSGNATTATTATNLSAAPSITSGGTATVTLSANTAYTLTVGGKSVIFKTPTDANTNTATAADNILNGSNSGTQITYAPYTTQQNKLSFDTSTTNPTQTSRLNLNGYLYATKLYSGGNEVLTSHQSLDGYKTRQVASKDLSTAGWYRILDCTTYSMAFFITFYGGYNHQPPTPVTFLVSHAYNTTKIEQIGRSAYIGWIKELRAIHHDTSKFYIDVYYADTSANACAFEITPLDPNARSNITLIDFTAITDSTTENALCETTVKSHVDVAREVNTTLKNTTSSGQRMYLLGTTTAPTATTSEVETYSPTSLWVNGADKGKFELVLGNATATTTSGGQFGQLALYSASTAGTYLKAADGTTWKTQTLQAKDGTIALTSDIPTNLNQLTNGPGYVTSSGITSVTIGATSPVQSSISTAQTGSSASTTISLKDAYGDTKNPYGTKAKNLVLAGPSSGSDAAPTFRELVTADIPVTLTRAQLINTEQMSFTNWLPKYGNGTAIPAKTMALFADGLAIKSPATSSDAAWLRFTGTGEADSVLEIATSDDANKANSEIIVVRQYNGSSVQHEAILLGKIGDVYGATSFPEQVSAPKFIGALQGNADTATAANITSTTNAIAYYTDTNATFGSKASADGALYATSANGALQWGTLPIAQGGTGVKSFTKNQVVLSDNTNGTTGLTSRAYSDSASAGALSSTSTNFVTERDIYYGLPTLNNAHNYNSSSTYYAPTAGGTAGHVLIGNGTTAAPIWYGGTVMTGTAVANWKTAFNGTTDATASDTAAVTIAGGLGIAKSIIVGDTATITNDTRSPKFTLTVDDTDKAYLQYNTTDNSIDFIFA